MGDYRAVMDLDVTVVTSDLPGPPPGTPVVVELRDTSLADAPSVTVASVTVATGAAAATEAAAATGTTESAGDDSTPAAQLATVRLRAPDDLVTAGVLTVFARVSLSREGRASSGDDVGSGDGGGDPVEDGVAPGAAAAVGDYLTTRSYPVTAAATSLVVQVTRVR